VSKSLYSFKNQVVLYLYLYFSSQHPEDGHMNDRNMSVTTVQ